MGRRSRPRPNQQRSKSGRYTPPLPPPGSIVAMGGVTVEGRPFFIPLRDCTCGEPGCLGTVVVGG